MDTNDFLGSVAQEDVQFTTRIVKTSRVGDNYWKVMVFVESDRFVNAEDIGWIPVPGSTKCKALTVTANDYTEHTTGVLRSWLYDLFCNGFSGDCILITCGPHDEGSTVTVYSTDGVSFFSDPEMAVPATIPVGVSPTSTGESNKYSYTAAPSSTAFIAAMEEAYGLVKAYAYHKTVCANPVLPLESPFAVNPEVAVAMADLCASDKGLLSSAPYLPFSSGTPEDLMSDPLYAALKNADKDAFLSAHQDKTRNAALYSLGLAMATLNGSGTSVGNSMDMIKSSAITSSGPNGQNLSKPIRDILYAANIQSFKPVGDNSGNVAAKGASTLKGEVVQAMWIVAYVTYMVKVAVARMITTPNFLKNASNYSNILGIMVAYLQEFGPSGSGRLENIQITAPSFGGLPAASGDEIIIPDAWSARYVDQVRKVEITGTLYIGEGE